MTTTTTTTTIYTSDYLPERVELTAQAWNRMIKKVDSSGFFLGRLFDGNCRLDRFDLDDLNTGKPSIWLTDDIVCQKATDASFPLELRLDEMTAFLDLKFRERVYRLRSMKLDAFPAIEDVSDGFGFITEKDGRISLVSAGGKHSASVGFWIKAEKPVSLKMLQLTEMLIDSSRNRFLYATVSTWLEPELYEVSFEDFGRVSRSFDPLTLGTLVVSSNVVFRVSGSRPNDPVIFFEDHQDDVSSVLSRISRALSPITPRELKEAGVQVDQAMRVYAEKATSTSFIIEKPSYQKQQALAYLELLHQQMEFVTRNILQSSSLENAMKELERVKNRLEDAEKPCPQDTFNKFQEVRTPPVLDEHEKAFLAKRDETHELYRPDSAVHTRSNSGVEQLVQRVNKALGNERTPMVDLLNQTFHASDAASREKDKRLSLPCYPDRGKLVAGSIEDLRNAEESFILMKSLQDETLDVSESFESTDIFESTGKEEMEIYTLSTLNYLKRHNLW